VRPHFRTLPAGSGSREGLRISLRGGLHSRQRSIPTTSVRSATAVGTPRPVRIRARLRKLDRCYQVLRIAAEGRYLAAGGVR
jgi:hypothetical protein